MSYVSINSSVCKKSINDNFYTPKKYGNSFIARWEKAYSAKQIYSKKIKIGGFLILNLCIFSTLSFDKVKLCEHNYLSNFTLKAQEIEFNIAENNSENIIAESLLDNAKSERRKALENEVFGIDYNERYIYESFTSESFNEVVLSDEPEEICETIEIECDQTGITGNNTRYDWFYNKWLQNSSQRIIADEWHEKGRESDKGIALIDGRYLVAVTTLFGDVGDNIDVILEDGTIIPCKIADIKNASDENATEYGHLLQTGGNSYAVDVIEWEIVVNKEKLEIDSWRGKKVECIKCIEKEEKIPDKIKVLNK